MIDRASTLIPFLLYIGAYDLKTAVETLLEAGLLKSEYNTYQKVVSASMKLFAARIDAGRAYDMAEVETLDLTAEDAPGLPEIDLFTTDAETRRRLTGYHYAGIKRLRSLIAVLGELTTEPELFSPIQPNTVRNTAVKQLLFPGVPKPENAAGIHTDNAEWLKQTFTEQRKLYGSDNKALDATIALYNEQFGLVIGKTTIRRYVGLTE